MSHFFVKDANGPLHGRSIHRSLPGTDCGEQVSGPRENGPRRHLPRAIFGGNSFAAGRLPFCAQARPIIDHLELHW